ncbi:MAG: LysM peptidoglycan-binding domain-containing protein [Dermatophilaceae bacterium]
MPSASNDIKRAFASVLRVVALSGGLLAVVALASGVLGPVLRQFGAGIPQSTSDVLAAVAAGMVLVLSGWLALGVLLEALARVPGAVGRGAARASRALSPVIVRRVAGVVLGVSVTAALTPSAAVADTHHRGGGAVVLVRDDLPSPAWTADAAPPVSPPTSAVATTPDPRWVAPPPVVRPHPDVSVLSSGRRATPQSEPQSSDVVVRRGDTLWTIAARHLGTAPLDSDIARAWPAWHAANRDVIGPDPDVLLPGQVLRAPAEVS